MSLLDAGQISARQIAQLYLDRIAAVDSQLHAVVSCDPRGGAGGRRCRRPRAIAW